MSFYKKHAPNHREHTRKLPDLSQFDALAGRIRGQARAEDRGHVDARLLRMLAGHPELRRGLPTRRASAGRRRP